MVTDALCDPVFASLPLSCECGEGCGIVGEITNAYCGNLGAISLGLNCGGNMMPIQSYIWSDGNESGIRENLMPGEYCVTVTDEENCEFDECFIINSGNGSNSMVSLLNIEHVTSCNIAEECGDVGCTADGGLSISVNSSEPYSLTWSGPNNFSSNQEELSNLKVGSYFLEVDFENPSVCDLIETYVILACRNIVWNSNINECVYGNVMVDLMLNNRTQVSNAMPCSGTIDISFAGGVTNGFEFQWEGPNGFMSHSEDLTDLCEGEYCIFVDDGCNGEEDYCFNIVNCDNADINIQWELSNTCPDVDFGSIDVFVQGGRMPYTNEWSNAATIQHLEKLFAGTYVVTVTDFNGCVETAEFIVTDENDFVLNRPNDECVIYYDCNGSRAFQDPIGVAGCEISEEDCRFNICTCNDGVELEPEWVGYSDYFERAPNDPCEIIRFCTNGEPFFGETILGTFTIKEHKVLDISNVTSQTVWYCCVYKGCIFDDPQYNITTDTKDNLSIAIVELPPNDCKYEAYCDDPVNPFFEYLDTENCIEQQRGNCNDFDIDDFSVFLADNSTIVRGKKYYQKESLNGGIILESEGHRNKMIAILKKQELLVINKVSPNPFSEEFVVQINSAYLQNISFSIITHTGQTIYSESTDLLVGENNKVIDLSSVKYRGLMILSIVDERNNIFRHKLIKL